MKIIEVREFSFRYANGSRESLSHVSLDVEEGTFNVLCGKSGCGKSTLLRQLKSDLAPFGSSSGKICYYGRDLKEVGHRQQSQEIGYVLQNPETAASARSWAASSPWCGSIKREKQTLLRECGGAFFCCYGGKRRVRGSAAANGT